jgi:hypothetical protein
MRVICITMGVLFTLIYLAAMVALVVQCIPVEAVWRLDKDATCFDFVPVLYAIAGFNIISDLALCLIPLNHCRKLQLPRKQRIVLGILFMGGGV